MKGSREIHGIFGAAISRANVLMNLGYRVTFYGDMQDGESCWVIEFCK